MPSNPPDAVSSAATPEWRCKCLGGKYGYCDLCRSGHLVEACCVELVSRSDATPEAQIPDKSTPWLPMSNAPQSGYMTRLNGEGHRETMHGSEIPAPRPNPEQQQMLGDALIEIAVLLGICSQGRGYTGAQALQLATDAKTEISRLESQLAALRVERDQAWNEAMQLAQGVVNEYSECFFDEKRPKLQYCYTHNTKHCTQKQTNELATQILARPIPAEPSHE